MPTFGRYELGEELSRRGATLVATAIRSESAGPTVVKVLQLEHAVLPSDQITSRTAAFLAAATTQQQVASSGSSHWAPIHDIGSVPDGAYYVTTQYRLSAQKLIRGKVRLPSPTLFALADGTIKGLRELKRVCGRSHGNLKATNILLESAERSSPVQVRLTDPAADADSCSEVGDLQALGAVLYELVTHQAAKGYASWPIPASAAWADLGRNGEGWRELCNRLLNPGADAATLTLDGVAYELAALSSRPGSVRWIRRGGLAASVAAVVVIGASVIHYAMTRPPSVASHVAAASQPTLPSPVVAAPNAAVNPQSSIAVPVSQPSAIEIALQQNQARLARERTLADWKATILPPLVHAEPLMAAWNTAVAKQTADIAQPDAAIKTRLDSLRTALEDIEREFPPPQGMREPFTSVIASKRVEFLRRAGELVAGSVDPAAMKTERQHLIEEYAAIVERQAVAQKTTDLLELAKAHELKEELPECIQVLGQALALSADDPEAGAMKARVGARMATPEYRQKVFQKAAGQLIDSLRAKVDASSPFTPDLYFALSRAVDVLRFDDPKGRELLDHVRAFADGKTPTHAFAEYLHTAFETPQQLADRMARAEQARAAADKKAKIESLLSAAAASDSPDTFRNGLASLDELLKLDPKNPDALRLKAQLLGYDPKSVTNSIGMKLVKIKPGTFLMGSPEDEVGRGTHEHQHKVTLTKSFYIQTTTVTQPQWKAIMGTTVAQQRDKFKIDPPDHSVGEGNDYPMYYVSWDDATEFCRKLSRIEGKNYRLPTESEWEYACRAGTSGPYGGTGRLDDMGWCVVNSGDQHLDSMQIDPADFGKQDGARIGANHCRLHPVGQKKPNAWGLYDMHGNVNQWCSDYYAPYTGDATDPTGPQSGDARSSRVLRGGSWFNYPPACRAASRGRSYRPDQRNTIIGFRVCMDPPNTAAPATKPGL